MATIIWIILFQALIMTNCLRLTEVRIPNHAVRHTDAHLECQYELDGDELYSVKFYKDGNEFYRYVPKDEPPVLIFNQTGVTVDLLNSTDTLVILRNISLQSSGRYRCEVSAEAPSFQTVSDHVDMVVVALPEEGPKITGGLPRYSIGDWVHVNCTSGRSKPATQLSWYINGDLANERGMVLRYPSLVGGREALETSTLGLKFQVRHKHFKKGDMKLKCLATIASVYWRSDEESAETERPVQTSTREYSEGILSNSRVDKIRAINSSPIRYLPNVLIILMLSAVYAVFEANSQIDTDRTSISSSRSKNNRDYHSITIVNLDSSAKTSRRRGLEQMNQDAVEEVLC